MKWLTRFRISCALDQRRRLTPRLKRKVAQSGDLRHWLRRVGKLDEALSRPAPAEQSVPPSLHASIMRTVRAARPSPEETPPPLLFRWATAGALAVAVAIIAAALWLRPGAPAPRGENPALAAANALELGGEAAPEVASALTAPMTEELDRLDRDLNRTAEILLASLP